MTDETVIRTSKTLSDLEAWIASDDGQRYSCTRQYPHPGYACDRNSKCVGCLMVAAALELRNKPPQVETEEQWEDGKVIIRNGTRFVLTDLGPPDEPTLKAAAGPAWDCKCDNAECPYCGPRLASKTPHAPKPRFTGDGWLCPTCGALNGTGSTMCQVCPYMIPKALNGLEQS